MTHSCSPRLRDIIDHGLLPAVGALEDASIPFCLIGSLGAFAHGGLEPSRDIDLLIKPSDLSATADALHSAGMILQLTPEDNPWEWWFFRAWSNAPGGALPIEIVYASSLSEDDIIRSSNPMMVNGHELPVATLTHLLALKLAGLREEHPAGGPDEINFTPLLRIVRAAGEHIDWKELSSLIGKSPYAIAFLKLAVSLSLGEFSGIPQGEQVIDHYVNEQHKRVCALRPVMDNLRTRYPVRNNYELLGPEYYDATRHPSCAGLRFASKALISALLPVLPKGVLLDVGAGDSLLAELLTERGRSLNQLLITDANPAMLMHSARWCQFGARTAIVAADELPVRDGEAGLLVSSLGDPYNELDFWREVARVLAPGGQVLFTAPAHGLALTLRHGVPFASLLLGDNGATTVPSIVLTEDEQRSMIENAGLKLISVTHFKRGDVPRTTVDDLDCLGPNDPVVTCFHCQR